MRLSKVLLLRLRLPDTLSQEETYRHLVIISEFYYVSDHHILPVSLQQLHALPLQHQRGSTVHRVIAAMPLLQKYAHHSTYTMTL